MEDLPPSARPRERLIAGGPQALSNDELLGIIFRTGTTNANAVELARKVLETWGDVVGLEQASLKDLTMTAGIGQAKATEIKAALELGKRLLTLSPEDRPQITGPRDVYALLAADMSSSDKEKVKVVVLNMKHRVQNVVEISRGTVNASPVRVGELFKDAVRLQATAIVMAHNHPSGDPTPSPEDVSLTERAVQAGRLLDIEVLDHVVIGRPSAGSPGWVSLKERNLGWS